MLRRGRRGRRRKGGRRRTARAARADLTLDPSLADEVEPDDPEVDALAAQVAVETAAHQHGFFHYVIQGDNFTRTLTLRNSFARRFSHLETTRRRSHNRQLSKDFTNTVCRNRACRKPRLNFCVSSARSRLACARATDRPRGANRCTWACCGRFRCAAGCCASATSCMVRCLRKNRRVQACSCVLGCRRVPRGSTTRAGRAPRGGGFGSAQRNPPCDAKPGATCLACVGRAHTCSRVLAAAAAELGRVPGR